MIDIEKMKALADETRHMADVAVDLGWNGCGKHFTECADAIDSLLSELEAANQKRKEAVMDAERAREERNREHVRLNADWIEKTAALRAQLEAREADRRDAERHRGLLDALLCGDIPMKESSISLNVCGVPPDQDEFDEAVDFALAQRQ